MNLLLIDSLYNQTLHIAIFYFIEAETMRQILKEGKGLNSDP